jgi:hypothetical protein
MTYRATLGLAWEIGSSLRDFTHFPPYPALKHGAKLGRPCRGLDFIAFHFTALPKSEFSRTPLTLTIFGVLSAPSNLAQGRA